jgi:hypothetical protein
VEDSRSTWQPCVCGSLPLAASGRATRVRRGSAKRTIFGNECRARRRGGSRTVPLRRIRRSGAHFQGWFRGVIVPSRLSRVPAVYRSPGPIIAATSPSSPTIRTVPPFSLAKRCCVPTPEICCRSWGSRVNVNSGGAVMPAAGANARGIGCSSAFVSLLCRMSWRSSGVSLSCPLIRRSECVPASRWGMSDPSLPVRVPALPQHRRQRPKPNCQEAPRPMPRIAGPPSHHFSSSFPPSVALCATVSHLSVGSPLTSLVRQSVHRSSWVSRVATSRSSGSSPRAGQAACRKPTRRGHPLRP